jgi:hypothetical protein
MLIAIGQLSSSALPPPGPSLQIRRDPAKEKTVTSDSGFCKQILVAAPFPFPFFPGRGLMMNRDWFS